MATNTCRLKLTSSKQFFAGKRRTLDERLEFGPHHRRGYALDDIHLRETTIRAGNHIFRTDQFRVANNPIGHQPGMFHSDRMVRDHSRNQDLTRRQFAILPDSPLVFMPGICGLNRIRAGAHLEDKVDDVAQVQDPGCE